MGCRPTDIVLNGFNYSLYAGGVADHMAFETLGAAPLAYGAGKSQRLLALMEHLQDDLCLYSTASYAIHLADRAAEAGVDLDRLRVRKGFFSGEAGLQVPGYRRRTVARLAERLAGLPAGGLARIKRAMNMASESNFASALALDEGYDLASFRSPETRQALADFLAARGRK